MALGAVLTARSVRGSRTIDAGSFFQGFLTTALADDELLEAVHIPARRLHTGQAFVEFARRHGDFAVVGVAACVELGESGRLVDVRLALCGVDAVPVRAREAEHLLVGGDAAPKAFEAAGVEAAQGLEPSDDAHGSAAHRRALVRRLVPRALGIALDRARDGAA